MKKWKKVLDKGGFGGVLLTKWSKSFDTLKHDHLIAKLSAYGFDSKSLNFVFSYLSGRFHRTKVNNAYNNYLEIIFWVPQGSILRPSLFKIYNM